jgi:hypothetical protein
MAISIYVYESSAAPAPVAFMSTFFEHHKFAVNTDNISYITLDVTARSAGAVTATACGSSD